MKKLIILIMLMLCCIVPSYKVYAYDGETDKPFVVYTDTGEYLFEKSDVAVNDSYISKEFKMYDIISIDKDNKTAIAKYVKDIKKPNVDVSDEPSPIGAYKKKICLYLTHNDESYVPTDGYDSIYGAGGVHDVARAIKSSFENLGIDVANTTELRNALIKEYIGSDYLEIIKKAESEGTLAQATDDKDFGGGPSLGGSDFETPTLGGFESDLSDEEIDTEENTDEETNELGAGDEDFEEPETREAPSGLTRELNTEA